jgi:hypothetical protein
METQKEKYGNTEITLLLWSEILRKRFFFDTAPKIKIEGAGFTDHFGECEFSAALFFITCQ